MFFPTSYISHFTNELTSSFSVSPGTMQIVDVRHIDLFLNREYQDGSWEYELIGTHDITKHSDSASGGIFDIKHLKDPTTAGNFC